MAKISKPINFKKYNQLYMGVAREADIFCYNFDSLDHMLEFIALHGTEVKNLQLHQCDYKVIESKWHNKLEKMNSSQILISNSFNNNEIDLQFLQSRNPSMQSIFSTYFFFDFLLHFLDSIRDDHSVLLIKKDLEPLIDNEMLHLLECNNLLQSILYLIKSYIIHNFILQKGIDNLEFFQRSSSCQSIFTSLNKRSYTACAEYARDCLSKVKMQQLQHKVLDDFDGDNHSLSVKEITETEIEH
jgi:hypothetical protein